MMARVFLHKVYAPRCIGLRIDGVVVVAPFIPSAGFWADVSVFGTTVG